jgi:glycosyltransferase involved in cell wall biosynthesis
MTLEATPSMRLRPAERAASLRIAVLAGPWIPVPPPGYGGIEEVVDLLCEELVARGHDVTLFAAPGSQSAATVMTPLERAHPDAIGSSLHESDHVASAWDAVDRAGASGRPFDVMHDHSGFTAVAMADRLGVPIVHSLHGPFTEETAAFYQRHGHKVALVAISRFQARHAPAGVRIAAVVPNPIATDRWPLGLDKDDYLLWIGRMDPVKGAHHAIEAARIGRRPLVMAGPVQPGQEDYFRRRIEPHIDGRRVRYVGEVTGLPRQQLFAGAAALLMPIRWDEPFGMVMVEALATGTPVIAFPEGAAGEIVIDGYNGRLVDDVAEMAEAVREIGTIDPRDCRESVRSRYDIAITTSGYEAVYRHTVEARSRRLATGPKPPMTTPRHHGRGLERVRGLST